MSRYIDVDLLEKDAILISMRPKWAHKILDGEKLIEARKTIPRRYRPKQGVYKPFKCFMYMTAGDYLWRKDPWSTAVFPPSGEMYDGSQKIIAEWMCSDIVYILTHPEVFARHPMLYKKALEAACLTEVEIEEYSGGKDVYGLCISNLKVYDSPLTLADFGLKRAPQSWCYVEDITERKTKRSKFT